MSNLTYSQDISRSVNQLCTQLSLTNIAVPKIDTFKNVFEFLGEFEMATAMLQEDQKIKLLAKAFPTGRHFAWYENEIIKCQPELSWQAIKSKITERYSDTEDRDRHLKRLETMKFSPDGPLKLFDYVEETLYSFSKAFPKEDEDTKIRYIKNKMPSAILPTLSTISSYLTATKLDEFLKGIRQYDILKARCQSTSESSQDKMNVNELVTVLKDLVSGIKQQQSSNVVSALVPRSSSPIDNRQREIVGRNSRRDSSPGRPNNLQYHNRSPSPYNRRYDRSPSPARPSVGSNYQNNNNNYQNTNQYPNRNQYNASNYQHNNNLSRSVNNYQSGSTMRGRSPPGRMNQQENYVRENNNNNNPRYYQPNRPPTLQTNNTFEAFNNEHYYQKFGYPPTPCANCQCMHWTRHCPDNLN